MTSHPSRFASLREAARPKLPKAPTIAELEAQIMGDDTDPEDAPLALAVDVGLRDRVWNGARFEDRIGQFKNSVLRTTLDQMEKSIMAQETYDDFEARMLKQLGLDKADEGPVGSVQRDLETRVEAEGRLGWNEAILRQHSGDPETIIVWSSRLLTPGPDGKGTTPGCAWRHGRTAEEMPSSELPRHWKCKCTWLVIPSPYSADPDIAAQGAEILAAMAADREAWLSENGIGNDAAMMESNKPSRFVALRLVPSRRDRLLLT